MTAIPPRAVCRGADPVPEAEMPALIDEDESLMQVGLARLVRTAHERGRPSPSAALGRIGR